MEWAAFDMIREKGVRGNNGRWGKQVEDVDGLPWEAEELGLKKGIVHNGSQNTPLNSLDKLIFYEHQQWAGHLYLHYFISISHFPVHKSDYLHFVIEKGALGKLSAILSHHIQNDFCCVSPPGHKEHKTLDQPTSLLCDGQILEQVTVRVGGTQIKSNSVFFKERTLDHLHVRINKEKLQLK